MPAAFFVAAALTSFAAAGVAAVVGGFAALGALAVVGVLAAGVALCAVRRGRRPCSPRARHARSWLQSLSLQHHVLLLLAPVLGSAACAHVSAGKPSGGTAAQVAQAPVLPPLPLAPLRCSVRAHGSTGQNKGNSESSSRSKNDGARGTADENGTLTLRLQLPPFPGFLSLCDSLAALVEVPSAPTAEDVRRAQATLRGLGYFADVQCATAAAAPMPTATAGIACALTPAAIVRDVHFVGHLPFALFQDDLRRRIFLRPGTVLTSPASQIDSQAKRLTAYLRQEGYFDAVVAITTRPATGGAPHQAIHLDVAISARKTASVRSVEVLGQPILPVQRLAAPFFHRGLFGYAGRFRPLALAGDVDEVQARLQRAGYVGARLTASYDVDLAARAVDITLRVHAGPSVRLRLEGERALSLTSLRRLMPFAAEGAVDAVAVESYRQAVQGALQAKGFAAADVEATLQRGVVPHTRVVVLQVAAGPRYRLQSVTIRAPGGGLGAALPRHAAPLRLRPSSRLKTRVWHDADAAADVDTLRARLVAAGYVDAAVRVSRTLRRDDNDDSDGSVAVCFTIEAGRRHTLASVRLLGVGDDATGGEASEGAIGPPEEIVEAALRRRLRAAMHLQVHQPLPPGVAEQAAQTMQLALSQAGYIDGEVALQDEVAEGADLVGATGATDLLPPAKPGAYGRKTGEVGHHLTFTVTGRRQAHLAGLLFRGNFRTRAATLRQEMKLRLGQPLNLSELGAAKRALRATNLFDTVTLTPHAPHPQAPATHLLLTVEERDGRSIDGVASYSSDYRFAVGADWQDGNLFGRAVAFRLTARLANARGTVPHLRIGDQDLLEAYLRAPHPWGLPLNVEGSAQYRYQDVAEYRERRIGGQAAISRTLLTGRRCALCPSLGLRLAYEINEAYRDAKRDQVDDSHYATIARLVPSLGADARDSVTDPRRGYNVDVRLEGAHPFLAGLLDARASSFWRLLVGGQAFVPLGTPVRVGLGANHALGGPVVLALAVNYGAAGPYGRRGAVPPSETFGYGGDASVRGLRNRASTRVAVHPDYLWSASTELRWYAVENFGFGSVQLAAFVDVGDVALTLRHLGKNPALSVGTAVRYVTPIGPLSVAYGRAVRLPPALRAAPDAAPRRGRIHFTFGYTF